MEILKTTEVNMFFQYCSDKLEDVIPEKINPDILTAGYVSSAELKAVAPVLGLAPSTVELCREANEHFRSRVEFYDSYTFTELRIIGKPDEAEDCVALYIGKNLFIVVDVEDHDGSTQAKFFDSLKRYSPDSVTLEKIIYAFLDSLVTNDLETLEDISIQLSDLEDSLLDENVNKSFNVTLLQIKKLLSRYHNYYEQLLDITEAIDENENDIFGSDRLMYINNISKKITRLKEDTDSLKSSVEHLQDAYSSYLDTKMNSTMKVFTVLTSIFFPLTIIVGWYGMNFTYMPELRWRFGYVYVILLSVLKIAVLFIIGKKKKWF